MNKELMEILRNFTEKQVNELPDKGKMVFYAIMDIADQRDELKEENKKLKMQLYSKDQVFTTCPNCGEEFLINQCKIVTDLQEQISDLEILVEDIKLDVPLNEEQEKLLDKILFRKGEQDEE